MKKFVKICRKLCKNSFKVMQNMQIIICFAKVCQHMQKKSCQKNVKVCRRTESYDKLSKKEQASG